MNWLKLDNGNIALWAFDFDGNILHMPTLLYLKNKTTGNMEGFPWWMIDQGKVDFHQYEDISWYFEDFRAHFVCPSPKNKKGFDGLVSDIDEAIERKMFSPSFPVFKEVFLVQARIWSLITSRSNSPDNFIRGLMSMNEKILTQEEKEIQESAIKENYGYKGTREEVMFEYFQRIVDYYFCWNIQTQKMIGLGISENSQRKSQAMHHWSTTSLPRKFEQLGLSQDIPLSFGFSDDGKKHIISMTQYFTEMIQQWAFDKNKVRLFFTGPQDQREDVIGEVHTIIWDTPYAIRQSDQQLEIRLDWR